MLRRKVSKENLARLERESRANERTYLKRLFAQMLVEDPGCAQVAQILADNAKAQLVEGGAITPQELHQLILDACTYVLRIREIADQDELTDRHAALQAKALMQDPELDTLATSRIEAMVCATLMFTHCGVKKVQKPLK